MIWITEEEEDLFELYELLTEARDDVDRKYPRKNDTQTNAIAQKFDIERWMDAHDLWFSLRKELKP